MTIYAPSDFNELREMLEARLRAPFGVAAIRYPRGGEPEFKAPRVKHNGYSIFGDGNSTTCIVTYGTLTAEAVNACLELSDFGIKADVLKLDIIWPLPKEVILLLMNYKNVLFFEEGILSGGIAEKVGFMLMESGYKGNYKATAVTGFVKQASVSVQKRNNNLDKDSIIRLVKEVNGLEQ